MPIDKSHTVSLLGYMYIFKPYVFHRWTYRCHTAKYNSKKKKTTFERTLFKYFILILFVLFFGGYFFFFVKSIIQVHVRLLQSLIWSRLIVKTPLSLQENNLHEFVYLYIHQCSVILFAFWYTILWFILFMVSYFDGKGDCSFCVRGFFVWEFFLT